LVPVECDVLVVGAGVVGLASARALPPHLSRILVESHDGFGREASSRNSEVIHSGIYYPPDSRKTRLCTEGRAKLYEYCAKQGVPHKKAGKILVAAERDEIGPLEARVAHAESLGIPVERWSPGQVKEREPRVRCLAAAHFPESGIVDSHSLMASLERELLDSGAVVAYRHRVTGIGKESGVWSVLVESPERTLEIKARVVLNAAGFAAADLSNRALGGRQYEHRPCRGRYFNLLGSWGSAFSGLVYPMPPKDGLGIHVTVDLAGRARLGPDVDWAGGLDCDWKALAGDFERAAARYLPGLTAADLSPGLIGIRPKLFVGGKAHPDFLVEEANGFVHCLGIESPGLTAALALGGEAARLAQAVG
jgi:L-2-hydroxyglutarate oxidase LhgO